MFKIKNLNKMLTGKLQDNTNLHYIAISNIEDGENNLRRWWHKKYRIPPKDIEEYTVEELYLEWLEDFYSGDPKRVDEFHTSIEVEAEEEWDGELDIDTQVEIDRRWKSLGVEQDKSIIDKYKTDGDEDLSPDEIKNILADVGRDLPGSKSGKDDTAPIVSNDEFEDTF